MSSLPKPLQEYLAAVFVRNRDRELWLHSPNRDLNDMTPNEYIENGREDEVFDVLKIQLGNILRNP